MKYSNQILDRTKKSLNIAPPKPDAVISRNGLGITVSLFWHNIWNFDATSPRGCKINFLCWFKDTESKDDLRDAIALELKLIFWCLIFTHGFSNKRHTKVHTKHGTFQCLKPAVVIAYNLGLTLSEAHKSPKFLAALKSSIVSSSNSRHRYTTTLQIFKYVKFLNNSMPHIQAAQLLEEEDFFEVESLLKKKIKTAPETNRTPLIPTRIFAGILASTENYLTDMKPYMKGFEELTRRYATDPYFWDQGTNSTGFSLRSSAAGKKDKYDPGRCIPPSECLKICGLEKFDFSTVNSEFNFLRVKKHLGDLQDICRLLIHCYSGMRVHEVAVLPFHAIKYMEIPQTEKFPLIRGYSSKLSGGNYSGGEQYWATCDSVLIAIEVAQSVARCALNLNSYSPLLIDQDKFPLFPSLEPNKVDALPHYPVALGADPTGYRINLLDFDFTIKESDMVELETFDAFSDWRENSDFEVGKIWPIASHQFRRSVAVYGSRSGMVSLPSLKTQFKHMSIAMTLLYAENSSFAINFLLEDDGSYKATHEVAADFVDSLSFNMMTRFEEQILKAEHKLTGGRGARIQKLKDDHNMPIILSDRDKTLDLVRTGQLSYRETRVGGCMKPTMCEYEGIDEILPCIHGCEWAILNQDGGVKLKVCKSGLQRSLRNITKGSPASLVVMEAIDKIRSLLRIGR